MTQKVLEIDVMVYNMTKTLQSLKTDNSRIENQQILKITKVEKHRNIIKWRAIAFFCETTESKGP